MRTHVILVLGRGVWTRGEDRWERWSAPEAGGTQIEHLCDVMARIPGKTVTLVFEPEGIAHQDVDCPKGSRTVFASISKVRAEYPFVVSEDIGWGMEPPEPVPGGSYSTLVHFELASGLSKVFRAGAADSITIPAAWSAFSVANACMRKATPRLEGGATLILLPDFVALATLEVGKRAFRSWAQPLSERDWKTIIFLASGLEQKSGPRASDGGRRAGRVTVIVDGEPGDLCPFWRELNSSARVDRVLGLDAFAEAASKMPARHPANLISGFPMLLDLNPCLAAASVAALSSAVLLAVSIQGTARELRASENDARDRLLGLRARSEILQGNRREMAALRRQSPDAPAQIPEFKAPALHALGDAIPDSLTLTRFAMTRAGLFELEAILVGGAFEPEGVRRSLAQSGFMADAAGGWTYDQPARRLIVRGKFEEPTQ